MATLSALVTAALVLVNPAANELSGPTVVGGYRGGEGAFIEDLAVHLTSGRDGLVTGDEEYEGDAAAVASVAIL